MVLILYTKTSDVLIEDVHRETKKKLCHRVKFVNINILFCLIGHFVIVHEILRCSLLSV